MWGVAYEINDCLKKTFCSLDKRECNGYIRKTLTFYPQLNDCKAFEVTSYVADINNEYFSPEFDNIEISNQINRSKGPSGYNTDYIRNLAKSMNEISLSINDDHLFDINSLIFSQHE